jgi:hypothetical protein
MLAVAFVPFAAHTLVPWGWVIVAMTLVLLGIALRHDRPAFAALVTIAIVAVAWPVIAQTICGSCIGCDPWWMEFFWICV